MHPRTLIALLALLPATTLAAMRTGQEVVDTLCVGCHGNGANGAPRVGDAKAWTAREKRGLTRLRDSTMASASPTSHHATALQVEPLELERAITVMVNASGGHWSEPIDRKAAPASRAGVQVVQSRCVQCHGTGEGGAPRIGDRSAWVKRASPGFDSLVDSAIRGHGCMPARGGMAELTDAEMRDAVGYMVKSSLGETK